MPERSRTPPAPDADQNPQILAIGRRAIALEAEALWTMSHLLDERFEAAVGRLFATSGRIVVAALGKSGHIARKITATLIATGTPAAFLHAGEALHGDLGMLLAGDTLLILSNSGGTKEFDEIIRYADALGVPVIAITSDGRSSIARAADICLLLPDKPEACPWNSAPTTSTTMMLAMGDALAVALMSLRGTQVADIRRVHPGGKLGFDLEPVSRHMHAGDALPLVGPQAAMPEVLETMNAKGFGVAGVVGADGQLLGVITDGDLRRQILHLQGACAEQVMTVRPRTLLPTASTREALADMREARITSLFVLDSPDDRRVIGLIHVHDLLRSGVR